MRSFSTILETELADLAAANRLRSCPETAGASRVHPCVADRAQLSFCSNDYLGLASHPRLIAAAIAAAHRDGLGASASRLISGDLTAHRELEAGLASFVGLPAALVFPTGFQANLGALTALAGSQDLIVSDALNHASIIDGCRLSRAKVAVYPHRDVAEAARLLAGAGGYRRRILVSESLFSMDGDSAPLIELAAAAAEHDAIFMVDEAHALGVLGPGGRGLCSAAGLAPDVLVGTLGKAFGAGGGFVAGARALRDILVNRARTFIYTTALPPPIAAAAGAALELVAGPEGDRLRARLAANRASLGEALARLRLDNPPPGAGPAIGPIVPMLFGTESRALAASAALGERGIFVPAIRPPTVSEGSARLRITLSAAHQDADMAALCAALSGLAPE